MQTRGEKQIQMIISGEILCDWKNANITTSAEKLINRRNTENKRSLIEVNLLFWWGLITNFTFSNISLFHIGIV